MAQLQSPISGLPVQAQACADCGQDFAPHASADLSLLPYSRTYCGSCSAKQALAAYRAASRDFKGEKRASDTMPYSESRESYLAASEVAVSLGWTERDENREIVGVHGYQCPCCGGYHTGVCRH